MRDKKSLVINLISIIITVIAVVYAFTAVNSAREETRLAQEQLAALEKRQAEAAQEKNSLNARLEDSEMQRSLFAKKLDVANSWHEQLQDVNKELQNEMYSIRLAYEDHLEFLNRLPEDCRNNPLTERIHDSFVYSIKKLDKRFAKETAGKADAAPPAAAPENLESKPLPGETLAPENALKPEVKEAAPEKTVPAQQAEPATGNVPAPQPLFNSDK